MQRKQALACPLLCQHQVERARQETVVAAKVGLETQLPRLSAGKPGLATGQSLQPVVQGIGVRRRCGVVIAADPNQAACGNGRPVGPTAICPKQTTELIGTQSVDVQRAREGLRMDETGVRLGLGQDLHGSRMAVPGWTMIRSPPTADSPLIFSPALSRPCRLVRRNSGHCPCRSRPLKII